MNRAFPATLGRTRTLVLLALAIASVTSAAMIGLAVYSAHSYQDANARVRNADQVILDTKNLLTSMEEAEAAERGFLLTGDSGYLTVYDNAAAMALAQLSASQQLRPNDPRMRELLPQLTNSRLADLEQMIAARKQGGVAAAESAAADNAGESQLHQVIASIETSERATAQARTDAANSDANRSFVAFAVLAVIGLAAVGGAFARLLREFRRRSVRAARAIEASEGRYRLLTETVPQVVWTADASGRLDYLNERWEERTGTPAATGLGDGWLAFVHPDDRDEVERTWKQSVASGSEFEAEYRLQHADGTFRWELMRALAMPVRQGTPRAWLGTSTDIHRQKRITQALVEASTVKDQFLGMVSHELRNPLVVLLGNARLLRKPPVVLSAEERATAVDEIEREANRLNERIDNMLILSRGTAPDVEVEPILLQRVVDSVVQAHRSLKPDRSLTMHLDDELPPVLGLFGFVEQVLDNLVRNAEKYTPASSPVVIAASRVGDDVEVRVLDRGPGVPAEDLPHLFDPFFRGAASASGIEGVGLGLAVCRRLVQAQGGRIWAEPRHSGGMEFGFALAACAEEPTGAEPFAEGIRREAKA